MSKLCQGMLGAAAALAAGAGARGEDVPFTQGLMPQSAPQTFSVEAVDMDGDGDMDLVSASFFTDAIVWYENVGGGINGWIAHVVDMDPDGTGPLTGFSNGPVDAYPADIDGDGDIDIVVASVQDNKIAWYENLGGSPPAWQGHFVATVEVPTSVYAFDVDLDGDMDILSSGFQEAQITVHRNNGGDPLAWGFQVESLAAFGATDVCIADMDGDFDPDIVSSSANDGKIAWYENLGGQPAIFIERSPAALSLDGANSVRAGDIDGDGDMDLVTAAFDDDSVIWLENIGGSPLAFLSHVVDSGIRGATSAAIADIDRDGDMDLIATGESNDQVIWYENTAAGAASFAARGLTVDPDGRLGPLEGNANGAQQAIAVDLDSDDDLDVVSASRFVSFGLMVFVNQQAVASPDVNGDGVVDGADLAFLLSGWGSDDPALDFIKDGVIDGSDLAALLANWTQ